MKGKSTGLLILFWNKLLPVVLVLCLTLFVSCGGGGGGGGSDDDTSTVAEISSNDIALDSSLSNSGVSTRGTQIMRGVVPNPSGSVTAYGGKAYLVLNDEKIQIDVTKGSTPFQSSIKSKIVGDKEYVVLGDKTYLAGSLELERALSLSENKSPKGIIWEFEVTFSINAGPNTISIEVYDINDTLFARLNQWNVIGAIEPQNMVITLSWNTNNTDIDLHVADMDNTSTHCYYSNKTAGDMVLDYDDVNGYGPEHVTVQEVVGTKTYGIRVYYYADHNVDAENIPVVPVTPTTATVTAQVNGETKISSSHSMTSESTSSGWTTGAHVWEVGELEVTGANIYDITLNTPTLTSYPSVAFTAHIRDGEGTDVEGLTSSNFYVVNAGTIMSPVTVVDDGSGNYTLTYTDITAGSRDVYIYVYKRDNEDEVEGGLSNTVTYGKNYALLIGINDYPGDDSDLDNCVNDANDLSAAFLAKGKSFPTGTMANSGWESANIHTLTDSGTTESAIMAQITAIGTAMKKYDLFVFSFSGHGSDGNTDATQYLCAYEDENWISVTDLSNALDDIKKPGNKITNLYVLLDACHSGNFVGQRAIDQSNPGRKIRYRPFIEQKDGQESGNSLVFSRDLQSMTNKDNVYVMTAVNGATSSWDDSELGNGVFTYYLLEGMAVSAKYVSAAAANADHDSWVTAEEAFSYADTKTNAWVTVANNFPAGSTQDPQNYDNDSTKKSRFIYNW